MIFRRKGGGSERGGRRGRGPQQRLAFQLGVATLARADRDVFGLLTPEQQAEALARHPFTQDSHALSPSGLLLADGVGSGAGGEAATIVVARANKYLTQHESWRQPPRTVVRMMLDAAAEADVRLARASLSSGTTLAGILRTNDPRKVVGYRTSDTALVHGRGGKALWRSWDQKIEVTDDGRQRDIVTNTFRGNGRCTRTRARQLAEQYRVPPAMFLDDPQIIELEPNDLMLMYTDGLDGSVPAEGRPYLDPEIIVAEAERYANPAQAAHALLDLPGRLTRESHERHAQEIADGTVDPNQLFSPAIDDITIGVGRLALVA